MFESVGNIGEPKSKKKIGSLWYILPEKYRPYGVNSVEVFGSNNKNLHNIIVDLSARALKTNYQKLISIETLSELRSNISNEALDFDSVTLLDAEIMNISIVNDLSSLFGTNHFTNMLYNLNVKDKYNVREWKYGGVSFKKISEITSLLDHIVFYDKEMEIERNKIVYKYVDHFEFERTLRVESFPKTPVQIRRLINLHHYDFISLGNILNSEEKVNYNILRSIRNSIRFDGLGSNRGLTIDEIEKKIGKRKIISDLNYDMTGIRNFLKSKMMTKKNRERQNKEYEKELLQMEMEDNFIADEMRHLDNLLQGLKES